MNLKFSIARAAAGGALLLAGQMAAQSAIVSLSPTAQNVLEGGSTSVDLKVAGLNPGGAPTLAAFWFELLYNPAFVTATSVTMGTALGATAPTIDLTSPGVMVVALSLEDQATAEALQATEPLTLFTIQFNAIAPGTSPIVEDPAAIGTANSLADFDEELIPYQFEGASITVLPAGGPPNGEVPEAGTTFAALALGGLVGRYAWRRSKAARVA